MLSSTSLVCSPAWIWIGPSGAARHTTRSVSGVTARNECGAMPTRPAGRGATMARVRSTSRRNRSGSLRNRRWPGAGRGRAETAIGVERGQQGKTDARFGGGGRDPGCHLAEVGVGPAIDIMVKIVELPDRGESRLQHLHVGECRDRLDVDRGSGDRGSDTSPRARSRSCRPRGRGARRARPFRAGRHGNEDLAGRERRCRQYGRRAREWRFPRARGSTRARRRCGRRAPNPTAAARDRKRAPAMGVDPFDGRRNFVPSPAAGEGAGTRACSGPTSPPPTSRPRAAPPCSDITGIR